MCILLLLVQILLLYVYFLLLVQILLLYVYFVVTSTDFIIICVFGCY